VFFHSERDDECCQFWATPTAPNPHNNGPLSIH
jgi:hypothetical protein